MSSIKKNDAVIVIQGKEKGKRAKVLKVFPKDKKIILEGLNLIKKHAKKRRQEDKAGIIEREGPISISNVMLYCSKCKKPVKVGFKQEKNTKRRICRKCTQEI